MIENTFNEPFGNQFDLESTPPPAPEAPLETPAPEQTAAAGPGDEPIDAITKRIEMRAKGMTSSPFAQTQFTKSITEPLGPVKKYMDMPYGYNRAIDNDDFYGQQEGVLSTLGKGVARFGLGVLNKTGEAAGFLVGLANPANWNADLISNAGDNAIAQMFRGFDEGTKDLLPTFQEAQDRNAGFWKRAFTDLDFWTTDVVDGLAFLASAWVPGMALSKLGLGARIASNAARARLGVSAAESAVEGSVIANNYLKKAESLKNTIDKFSSWGMATLSESMFEAAQTRQSIYDSLTTDETGYTKINPETGLPYTEDEKRRIAGSAANSVFLMNATLLAGTNLMELKWFNTLMGKTEAKAISGIMGGERLGADIAVSTATTGLEKMLQSRAGAFAQGAFKGFVNEGLVEENAQLAIQRVRESYGMKGQVTDLFNVSEVIGQYASQTAKAFVGDDPEAAVSIGIGGILGIGGGFQGLSDSRRNSAFTQQVVEAYNQSQQNWLKFGNIYKTQQVKSTDANGNEVITERVVMDQNGKPVTDADKLAAITTSFRGVNGAIEESAKLNPGFQRDVLRDQAFGQFVLAHLNAGLESELMKKLEGVVNMTPEDQARLGFVPGNDLNQQVARYKKLAATILEQNKLINSDILTDGTAEDRARKNYMIQLAAEQAVYKNLAEETNTSLTTLRNQMVNSENSSLSDGIVDQLNELQQRINSQMQVVDELDQPGASELRKELNKNVLEELKESYTKLEKDNQNTVSRLKKDKAGFYLYENPERNQPGLLDQYRKKSKLKGELLNQVRVSGQEWGKYADTLEGKKAFMGVFQQEVVEPIQQMAEEAEKEEQKSNVVTGKTVTLRGVRDGVEKTLDITEGKYYVGKLNKSERFRRDKKVTTVNNDSILISKIDEENGTANIVVNDDAGITVTLEELAEIAIAENWVAYDSLKPTQKLYLKLRNMEISYRVIERDASNRMVKSPDGKYKTRVVKGRVTLNKKDKETLEFKYIDPISGKTVVVDFEEKYLEGKKDLQKLLTTEQAGLAEQRSKTEGKLRLQQNLLAELIEKVEKRLADGDKRREAAKEEFNQIEADLTQMKSKLEEAFKYLQANPYVRGRKSNQYKLMDELAQTLPAKIAELEQKAALLSKELEDLTQLREALVKSQEYYYQGLIQLEETGQPFMADSQGRLAAEEEDQLAEVFADQLPYRDSPEELFGPSLEQMIQDTDAELDLVKERLDFLNNYIEKLRGLLRNVLAHKDIYDVLGGITDRDQLRNQIKLMESQSVDDPLKMSLLKEIRKGLAKGTDAVEDTIRLVNDLNASIREMDELAAKHDELVQKLIRYETAAEQQALLTGLQERVDFLQTVQNGLKEQYEIYKQEATQRKQAAAAEVAQKQLLESGAAETEISQDGSTFEFETAKPVIAKFGLFMSTGRNFEDDADTKLNMNDGNARFFKFSDNADLLTDDYFLLPVTANNDTFGIRNTQAFEDDIKLVVVKKVNNEFKYVGMTGEVLDNPTKDTIIYTSMRGNKTLLGDDINAAIKYVEDKHTVKGLSKAEIADYISRLKSLRNRIKADIAAGKTFYLPVIGKTQGIQTMLPKSESGLPQELSLEGRLIESDTMDFNNMVHPDGQTVTLNVSTLKDGAGSGVKPGRAYMQKADGTVFRVFNRQMSQEEKDNFIESLKMLSGLMPRVNSTTSPLTRQENLDLKLLLNYINGVVFWADGAGDGANRFYVNSETGMLHRGGVSVPFTVAAIEASRTQLTEGLYHQVNNKMVKSKDPFFQLVVDNGRVTPVEYQNYTHYLLGSKDIKGNDRKLGTPVVYTNVPAYSVDDLTPQMKSVNLIFQDPDNPLPQKVTFTQGNNTMAASAPAPGARPTAGQASYGIAPVGEPIPFVPGQPFGMTFGAPAAQSQQPQQQAAPATQGFSVNQNVFSGQGSAAPQTQAQPAAPAPGPMKFGANIFSGNGPAVNTSTAPAQVEQTPVQPTANPFMVNPAAVKPAPAPVSTPSPATQATTNTSALMAKLLSEQYQASIPSNVGPSDSNIANELYRLAIDRIVKTENFKKLEGWFSKNLPGFPINKMAEMIDGKAWGAFKNGAIYIFENAEEGTGYHEAFEAVWASFLTDQQQKDLAAEFRSRPGQFTNPFSKETKNYSEASMYDVREMLAEEFRSYVLDQDSLSITGKIAQFFKELWNAIKSVIGLPVEAETLINNVFKDINRGKFANAAKVRDVSQMGTVYRQDVPNVTQEFMTQVTEGMTGFFFMNLYKDKKNIDSLIGEDNTNELLKQLFLQSMEDMKSFLIGPDSVFNRTYVQELKRQIGRDLTLEELQQAYGVYVTQDRNARQIEEVLSYPNYVYDKLKRSLRKFGLEFREVVNEEAEQSVNSKEEDVKDNLGIVDAIYIDPRRLTATNFKMLLGSLTQDTYNQSLVSEKNPTGVTFQRNNIGLPKLVDFDSVHTMLINELNGSLSRIEDGKYISALDEMLASLDRKYKGADGRYRDGYVWIERLKNRLKVNQLGTAPLKQDDIMLLVGFEKSLMNKQNKPVKTIIGENGYIYDTDPIQTNSESKIREEWENNVIRIADPIGRKSPNNLLGVDDKGMIVIDRNSHPYKGNPANNTMPYLAMTKPTFEQMITILGHLGIQFTRPIEELKKYKVLINRSYSAIREKIMDGTIRTMEDLYGSNIVNKPISDLVSVQTEVTPEDNVLMHMTADGKPQYSITLPSNVTYVVNSLNRAKNLRDFISSNPQFGYVDGEGNVVLHPYQFRSKILAPGGLFFDDKGNKRPGAQLNYHLISGVSDNQEDGTNTADLDYPDRVMQEIHYMLGNIHYTIINSDKSTEFGLGFNAPFVTFTDASAQPGTSAFSNVMNIYREQLEDEMDAAIREKALPSNIQYYGENVTKLGHFREILGPDLVKVFTDKVLTKKMTKQDFINRPDVAAAIIKHVVSLTDETLQGLIDLDIIERVEVGLDANNKPVYQYKTNAISAERLMNFGLNHDQMNQAEVESLAAFLAINKEVAVTEQHKFIYGHPAMYKDLAKRANGANSTKDAIVDNYEVLKWMDQNMARLDGKVRTVSEVQTFKNISFKDVTSVSRFYKDLAEGMYQSMKDEMTKAELETRLGARFTSKGEFKSFILDSKGKPTGELGTYAKLNEADAQAWILPDMYRDMLFLSAKISKDQLRQWEYEQAYEVITRSSKPKNHPAYKDYSKIYSKEQMKSFRDIYNAGSPGAVMQVLKPQYFGYANNKSLMQTVFLKHSVQPKFYRTVEGTQYETLYLAAQKNQVDIVGFESGEKVGNMLNKKGEFLPIYNNIGGINTTVEYDNNGNTKSVELPQDMPVQELFTRYYGIQQEVPSLAKNKVVRGTQVTKLVMSNFYSNGVPTSERAAALIKDYNDTLEKMIRVGKKELLDELGLVQLEDGSYITVKPDSFVKILRDELDKRDLPENLIEAIQVGDDGKLRYKIDTLANRDKIDNILSSIVNSRVISDKMFGKAAVQVAATGYEFANRQLAIINDNGTYQEVGEQELTPEQMKRVVVTSSDLSFYHVKDGKIQAMEVYMPWFFEGVEPESLGFKLVNGVYQIPANFDKRLLEAIGFRIPTQGMNSIENIIIKGFLPKEAGDMVVVPSEIVGKAGSDFDIDKLNMYLSNYGFKYSKFTPQAVKDFKDSAYFKGITASYRRALESMSEEDFKTYLDDLNNFSVTTGKGKYGNLDEWIAANNISATQAAVMIATKEALVAYNEYRRVVRQRNQDERKNFEPVVEEIVYVEPSNDSKSALQNKFKTIMQDLVSLPENYRQLIVPNGSATLEALADDIKRLKRVEDSESSYLALRKFIPMAEVRERYLTGKQMVGIAALQTTSHTMAQVSGLKLTGKYDPKSLYFLFGDTREKDINIRLQHNTNENGELYLYAKKDKSGRWISELLSEALTGFVDAAKNPFVFDLNLSLKSAGTWFYLQKLGVPVQDVAYLFNQPIVDEYFKEQAKNNTFFKNANGDKLSSFLMVLKVMDPYLQKFPKLKDSYADVKALTEKIPQATNKQDEIAIRKAIKTIRQKVAAEVLAMRTESVVSTDQLRNAIEKYHTPGNNVTTEDARFQLAMLVDFLEYSTQGRFLSEFIRSIGYDNTRTKSVIENMGQEATWNKMIDAEFIANPEAILDKTFLGEMKAQKEDIFKMFESFFVSLHPKAKPAFEPLYDLISNREVYMSRDVQSDVINRYQNFFINYLAQTVPFMKNNIQTTLNSQYEFLMRGAMSMGKQLKMLREVNDPNITENPVVKELLPVLTSDVSQVDGIKLFKSRMDTFKTNVMIDSIENLRQYAQASGNKNLETFTENLAVFAILQSGLQSGSMNFSKVLPISIYTDLVNRILTNFTEGIAEINPYLVWKQFHQNNWRNSSIVPKVKFGKYNAISGTLKVSAGYGEAEYQFLKKTVIRPEYRGASRETIDAMLKAKRGNEIFDTFLFERMSEVDNGDDINVEYRMINKLGDRFRFTEVYTDDRPSMLPQNNNVDSTTGYITNSYVVKDGVTVAQPSAPSVVTPVPLPVRNNAPQGTHPFAIQFNDAPAPQQAGAPQQKVLEGTTELLFDPALPKVNIFAGTGENAELSNFAKRPFIYSGGQFDSVEQAFQEAKLGYTKGTDADVAVHKKISESESSAEIKRLGGTYPSFDSKSWDSVSSKLMKTFIKLSFEQNPKALEALLATGNAELTHTQDKSKWGKEFPKLLMEVRKELRTPVTAGTLNTQQSSVANMSDAEIVASAEYRSWLEDNDNLLMSREEILAHYKQCKLGL